MFAEFDEQCGVPPEPGALWNAPLDLQSMLDAEPVELGWFIQKRIPAGRGSVCSGIGGSSKTTFLKHLAVGAVLGRLPWNWTVETTGRALLVLTEDTAEEAFRSLYYMCEALNLTYIEKEKLFSGLVIYPLAGVDVTLLQRSKKGSLENSALFEALVRKIQQMGDCVFVGLDPALSITDGNEQDQADQRRLGKMCDNLAVLTGAAVMLVCHAAKTLKEEISSHNSRGASSLVDAVRSEFVLRTMTKNEARRAKIQDAVERFRLVQLVATKGNHLPPEAYLPVWLRRGDFGILSEADVSYNDEGGISEMDKKALKILAEMCQGGLPVKLVDWRNAMIERGIIKAGAAKTQETAAFRIRRTLYDNGLIRSPRRGHWEIDPVEAEEFDL